MQEYPPLVLDVHLELFGSVFTLHCPSSDLIERGFWKRDARNAWAEAAKHNSFDQVSVVTIHIEKLVGRFC